MTAPATTGPANGAMPASSTPAIKLKPCSHKSISNRKRLCRRWPSARFLRQRPRRSVLYFLIRENLRSSAAKLFAEERRDGLRIQNVNIRGWDLPDSDIENRFTRTPHARQHRLIAEVCSPAGIDHKIAGLKLF